MAQEFSLEAKLLHLILSANALLAETTEDIQKINQWTKVYNELTSNKTITPNVQEALRVYSFKVLESLHPSRMPILKLTLHALFPFPEANRAFGTYLSSETVKRKREEDKETQNKKVKQTVSSDTSTSSSPEKPVVKVDVPVAPTESEPKQQYYPCQIKRCPCGKKGEITAAISEEELTLKTNHRCSKCLKSVTVEINSLTGVMLPSSIKEVEQCCNCV